MIAYKTSMIFHPLILHSPVQIYDISHISFSIINKLLTERISFGENFPTSNPYKTENIFVSKSMIIKFGVKEIIHFS